MLSGRNELWVAVIGDMVHSRDLSARKRATAQREFSALIEILNETFRSSIRSEIVITLGDEFQGLLSNAEIIPDIIWTIEKKYHRRDVRLGFGLGTLHTPMQPRALNIDGPVLHNARAAIDTARSRKMLGGVFIGFGAYDEILTGFAQVLRYVREHVTPRRREIVERLRQGEAQIDIATKLEISKQAVSKHAAAAGWDAYRTAEQGWKAALALAVNGARK